MSAEALVLASQSPRRRELLAQLGLPFAVRPAHIDETPRPGEAPPAYVARTAREKAAAVQDLCGGAVLAADTSVVVDREILGKPADRGDARAMLRRLSGRGHSVLTAVCLHTPDVVSELLVETEVLFATLTAQHIERYLATDEPWDKAGAYAIQGAGGVFVRAIRGSYSNVVGLPLCETLELLNAAGLAGAWQGARDE
jgi:septum formation protein